MNAKSKIFAIGLFMISAVLVHAASPVKMAILADATSGIYKVVYKAAEVGKVKISIFDEKHELIFTETLNNVESFVRPYNLSNLDQGQYTIVVEDKNGRTEEKVNYTFKKVESAVEITKIANELNKYLFTAQNTEADQIVVRIYDQESNLLHEQSMTVNGKVNVVFNLNEVKTTPTFVVTGSNGEMKTINY